MASVPKVNISEVEAETQSEIEQIMSEIEELQQEMNTSVPSETPDAMSDADLSAAMTKEMNDLPEITDLDVPPTPEPPKPPALANKKLQAVPSAPAQPTPVPAAELPASEDEAVLKDFSGQGEEPWLEETLAHLKAEHPELYEINEEAPASSSVEESEISSSQASQPLASGGGNSISMTVTGSMTLKLAFPEARQEVSVHFSPDYIRVSLSQGTEMTVPIRKNK